MRALICTKIRVMNSLCKFIFSPTLGLFFILMSTGVNAFASESKCPEEFEKIDKLVIIKPNSIYKNKSSRICVEKNGGFHVLSKANLVISDAVIFLAEPDGSREQGALATLEPGSFIKMDRVQVKSIGKPIFKEVIEKNKGKLTSHITGVSRLIVGATTPDLGIRLEISKSSFLAEKNYSLGGILIQPSLSEKVHRSGWTTRTMPEMALQRDVINTAGVSGWIKDSKFNKIFTPVALIGANNFEVSNNYFSENPGGNIVASGSGVSIKKNKVIFPGNGYVGDGITIYTYFENSSIDSNIIIGGSCYGIQVSNPEVKNLVVSNNQISSGITNGFHMTNDYKKSNKNIRVFGNYISGNAGFGIGIDSGVRDVLISSNIFAANAKSFGEYDIAISRSAAAIIEEDNLSAVAIDLAWAEKSSPSRTHVNPSLRVLKF